MNSSSKVIMAATMVMVVSLVMVLSLVLVLLAELYCSLLLRRRRRNSLTLPTTTIAAAATTTSLAQAISTTNEPSPSSIDVSPNPLTTGVLQTPKSFLITKTHIHHESSSLPASPDLIREVQVPIDNGSVDNFIYISNPMYSNEATSKPTTPFETPESSPSRLETGESSSSGEEDNDVTEVSTPTLTPMKDLPEKACSVSLKGNARSLESSASESNSNNNNNNINEKDGGSSSSSGSPSYTSPSW